MSLVEEDTGEDEILLETSVCEELALEDGSGAADIVWKSEVEERWHRAAWLMEHADQCKRQAKNALIERAQIHCRGTGKQQPLIEQFFSEQDPSSCCSRESSGYGQRPSWAFESGLPNCGGMAGIVEEARCAGTNKEVGKIRGGAAKRICNRRGSGSAASEFGQAHNSI